jgi:hypothetical protein
MVGAAELITACSEYLLAFCLLPSAFSSHGSDGAARLSSPKSSPYPEPGFAAQGSIGFQPVSCTE